MLEAEGGLIMSYKNPEDAKASKRRWYEAHREEIIARSARWQKDNAERYKEWLEGYREEKNASSLRYYYKNKQHVLDYQTQWRADNPEKKLAQNARYRERNREAIQEKGRRYHRRTRGKAHDRHQELRLEVIAAYGNKCTCCAEVNLGFITIDHVFNDGAEHRREVGSGKELYKWLKEQGYPKDRFRLLCYNCNIGRFHNKGTCPHERICKIVGELASEVYAAYGNRCKCCGEANVGFFTIDHVFNDGKEHRREVGSGEQFYLWLWRNKFPEGRFQLLCWNCNMGRANNGGVCPHVKLRKVVDRTMQKRAETDPEVRLAWKYEQLVADLTCDECGSEKEYNFVIDQSYCPNGCDMTTLARPSISSDEYNRRLAFALNDEFM